MLTSTLNICVKLLIDSYDKRCILASHVKAGDFVLWRSIEGSASTAELPLCGNEEDNVQASVYTSLLV